MIWKQEMKIKTWDVLSKNLSTHNTIFPKKSIEGNHCTGPDDHMGFGEITKQHKVEKL